VEYTREYPSSDETLLSIAARLILHLILLAHNLTIRAMLHPKIDLSIMLLGSMLLDWFCPISHLINRVFDRCMLFLNYAISYQLLSRCKWRSRLKCVMRIKLSVSDSSISPFLHSRIIVWLAKQEEPSSLSKPRRKRKERLS